MFRYIAFAWDSGDRVQKEIARGLIDKLRKSPVRWSESLMADGLAAFSADSRIESMHAHQLGNGGGVVYGMLFARASDLGTESSHAAAKLSDEEQWKVIATRGRRLVEAYWGNYVAILRSSESGTVWVVKDPTGSLPCFYSTHNGLTLIFSCLQDAVSLDLMQYEINWTYVRQRVATCGFFSDQSSLHGVKQVHRGQAVAISTKNRSCEAKSYWNPLTFSEQNAVEDCDAASRMLRATVRQSTESLVSAHRNVLVRVSGGLDSSIVVACLKHVQAKPNVIAYTYYNPSGGSDERRWARLALKDTGYEHFECPFEPTLIDLSQTLEIAPTVEPSPTLMYLTRRTVEQQFMSTQRCTGVLSGEGGDSSFGSEALGDSVDEHVKRHGLTSHAVSLAGQVAAVMDTSAWSILLGGLKRRYGWSSMTAFTDRFLEGSRLLPPELRKLAKSQRRFAHPWFADREEIPWETINRLGALVLTPECYDPFLQPHEPCLEHLAPLYSQPVVELCLQIPTYVHFANGRDRGIARRAFAGDVPEPILRRQWKDRAPGFASDLAHKNLSFLKAMLLDGSLVREGLLERDALERALSGQLTKSEVAMPELFGALDVELWIRSVSDRSKYKVAA